MEPGDRREPIFELAEKFQFLKESQIARDCCGHANSQNSLCKKLGIHRNTIRASLEKGGLTAEHQRILAKKCGFSMDWSEWNDRKADRNGKGEARSDTCEAFKAKYREHHSKEKPKRIPPSAEPALLKEDLSAETERYQSPLASLALRFGQSEPLPGEATLKFELTARRLPPTFSQQELGKAF